MVPADSGCTAVVLHPARGSYTILSWGEALKFSVDMKGVLEHVPLEGSGDMQFPLTVIDPETFWMYMYVLIALPLGRGRRRGGGRKRA